MNTARILSDMEVMYRIVTSEFRSEDCEGTQVYGLKAVYYGYIYEFVEILDISCKKEDVARLIGRLMSEDVEPGQLIYIVEDYIADLSTA